MILPTCIPSLTWGRCRAPPLTENIRPSSFLSPLFLQRVPTFALFCSLCRHPRLFSSLLICYRDQGARPHHLPCLIPFGAPVLSPHNAPPPLVIRAGVAFSNHRHSLLRTALSISTAPPYVPDRLPGPLMTSLWTLPIYAAKFASVSSDRLTSHTDCSVCLRSSGAGRPPQTNSSPPIPSQIPFGSFPFSASIKFRYLAVAS